MKGAFTLFKLSLKHAPSIKKLLIVAVALEIVSIVGLYFLNQVYGTLYQGIQEYNTAAIWSSIAYFAGIAMGLVLVNGYLGYFLNKLQFAIRAGLTTYCQTLTAANIPQYNQRVQEDLKFFGERVVEVSAAVFKAGLKLPVFVGVIVTLTKWYVGLIIVGAVIIGTILTRLAGRKLIPLQAQQESNEASFRDKLQGFIYIENQFKLINQQIKKLSFLQSGLGQVFVLLPFIILMPLYLAKTIPMGQFFQSTNALGKIIDSLTILIDSRQLITQLESTLLRLEWLHKK